MQELSEKDGSSSYTISFCIIKKRNNKILFSHRLWRLNIKRYINHKKYKIKMIHSVILSFIFIDLFFNFSY